MADETVRDAQPGDVAGIRRVARDAWHDTYDDIIGPDAVDELLADWYDEDAIEGGIAHDGQDFFVATVDGQVVGYAHAGPHPPRRIYQLYRIYVDPNFHGERIGTHLLARIEEALVDRDVELYEVEVLADNEGAVAFYESSGFERVAENETEMAGVEVTEYRYEKPI